ncbi:MAG: MFS transporter [Acidimicrobiales bacterium]
MASSAIRSELVRIRASASPDGGTGPRAKAALATVCGVLFVTFLDTTVVAAGLADIQADLRAGVASLQWVVSGYALAFAALMLAGGTLGDRLGRKAVMATGLVIFSAGSLLGALAPSAIVLILARVVMGVGAAASEPGTLSVLHHLYPDRRRRAQALGTWSAVSGLALALGPVLGGVMVGLSGWRGIFWLSLGLGLLGVVATLLTVPESRDRAGGHLDLVGVGLGALAVGAATYAVIAGEGAGYDTWWVVVSFVVAVLALAAFVGLERRTRHPVLPPGLFADRSFTGATLAAFATFLGVFAVFFFVLLYLSVVVGTSAYQTALAFIPMAAAMIGASVLTGRWVARSGPRTPLAIGCLLAGLGLILTDLVLGPKADVGAVAGALVVAGVGFGMAMVPATSAALSAVAPARSGLAASVINTARALGAVIGVAALGAVVNAQLTGQLAAQLRQLGLGGSLQEFVIHAVTSGGLTKGAAVSAEQSFGPIVSQVVQAAYDAFGAGLDLALLASGAMLVAAAFLVAATVRGRANQGDQQSLRLDGWGERYGARPIRPGVADPGRARP